MRSNHTILACTLMLFLLACNKETAPDCFKKNGTETSEIRYTLAFSEIVLNTDVDVELIQSAETKIEVMGGKNILPKIITEVNNNTLVIDNNNACNFVRGYKRKPSVKVVVPYIRTIRNKGVGTIRMGKAFVQDSLQVFLESVGDIHLQGEFNELVANSGSHGDVYIEGKAKRFFVYLAGTNYLKAENLLSDYVYVNTNGLGDCYVNLSASSLFEYTIRNSGNIYHKGQALTQTNFGTSGSTGKLIQLP